MKKYFLIGSLLLSLNLMALEQNEFLEINNDKEKIASSLLKDLRNMSKFKESLFKLKSISSDNEYAAFDLGVYFEYKKEIDKSILYYKKAIEIANLSNNNDILKKSFFNLGLLYMNKDKDKSIFYFKKASELGVEKTYLILGDLTGNEDYYKKAIKNGIFYSNLAYAKFLFKNNRIDESKKYAKKAFENKEDYIFYLGFLKDKNKQLYVLKQGIKDNDIKSKEILANSYIHGIITPVDLNKAIAILKDLNSKNSFYLLGEIYYKKGNLKKSLFNFNRFKYMHGSSNEKVESYIDNICDKQANLCLKF